MFIGDQDAAKNVRFLKHLRITHVLNTAEGQDENLVDLSAAHYEGTGIEYKVPIQSLCMVKLIGLISKSKETNHFLRSITEISCQGFLMWDSAWFDVSPFIDEAVDFITSSIDVAGGRCLVNCQVYFM